MYGKHLIFVLEVRNVHQGHVIVLEARNVRQGHVIVLGA